MYDDDDTKETDEDWETRVLCSDGSCIGTIGTDGNCRECGLKFKGELPTDFGEPLQRRQPSATDAVEQVTERAHESLSAKVDDAEYMSPDDDEWARRTLCRDESCIGVVSEIDGCCKECGKRYRQHSS